jgi:hypothetical protein
VAASALYDAPVLLALRFVKLLCVFAAFAGAVGAFLPEDLVARRRAAFWLGIPGIACAWAFGFFLAAEQAVPLLQGWVLGAMVLSFFSLQVLLWSVAKDGRRSPTAATFALVPLLATVALMVFRP